MAILHTPLANASSYPYTSINSPADSHQRGGNGGQHLLTSNKQETTRGSENRPNERREYCSVLRMTIIITTHPYLQAVLPESQGYLRFFFGVSFGGLSFNTLGSFLFSLVCRETNNIMVWVPPVLCTCLHVCLSVPLSLSHPNVDAPHVGQQDEIARSSEHLESRIRPHIFAQGRIGEPVPSRPHLYPRAKTKQENKRLMPQSFVCYV